MRARLVALSRLLLTPGQRGRDGEDDLALGRVGITDVDARLEVAAVDPLEAEVEVADRLADADGVVGVLVIAPEVAARAADMQRQSKVIRQREVGIGFEIVSGIA